jgi:predicted alpha/beta superfamily hydrolase
MRFSYIRATILALSLSLAASAGAQLTVRVTNVPPSTPAGATIHIAGSFNGWNPGAAGYALSAEPNGSFTITLPGSVRGPIEFKFTLGSWARVERTDAGEDVPNRSVTVRGDGADTLTVSIGGWKSAAAVATKRKSTASRSVSVLSDTFAIPQLGRTRRVWLYLPPGYVTSKQRYPVLYMLDGQNVFDAATSFAGEWGVDETLDSLHATGQPDAIVVAIDNGGTHRLSEYNPWPNPDPKLGGGEGDEFVEFLVRTLKPYIDRHYRTRRDPAHTGIMGSSAGGLIALYASLARPSVFGRAGVFSCACWLAEHDLYGYARRARPRKALPRFYFVSGAMETQDGQPARDQQRVVDTLVAAGFPLGSALHAVTPADGKHAEWFWRREFPAAYRWLFGR